MASRASLWLPVVVYMAAIFYASSLPEAPILGGTDKPLHGIVYFGFGVVVVRAVAGGLPRIISWSTGAKATLIAVAYATTDELHQLFVPGRSADLRDLIADTLGVILGAVCCWVWGRAMSQVTGHKSQLL